MSSARRRTRVETAAPCASHAYSRVALEQLTDDELAALERFCVRAQDDPEAEPADDEERAAVARYEGLVAIKGTTRSGQRRAGRGGR